MRDITRQYLDETRWHRTTVDNFLNRGLPYYGDGDRWMLDYRRMMRRLHQLAEAGMVVGVRDNRGRDCWVRPDALSPEESHYFAHLGTPAERQAVAGCASTPQLDLDHLAGDSDSRVLRAAAANPSTPPEAVTRLAGDQDDLVRRCAAGNPACPPEAVVSLLGDDDERVREVAGSNPALPTEYRLLLTVTR